MFYRAEAYGFSVEFLDYVRSIPVMPERGSALGRALLEGKVVHIADVQADPEYTFVEAQRLGDFRTVLGVPILREGVPIGVLALTRSEVSPFTDGSTLRYRASKRDCDVCAFKMQCCPHTPARQIPRDLHEDARDVARALAKTEAFEQSRRERKKVEMCFAHMKRIFKLDRLRLRGLSAAKDEELLTAIAQNLRRLVKFLCRPPPSASVTCAA